MSEPERRSQSPNRGKRRIVAPSAEASDVLPAGRGQRRIPSGAEEERDVLPGLAGIAALAGRQKGHVTRSQLLALGLRTGQIERRIASGQLIVRHRGVYAVGHLALPQFADEAAAILALAPRACLRARSAAYLHGISLDRRGPRAPAAVEVLVAGRRPRPRQGVALQSTSTLAARDLTTRHGLPVTAAGRVIVDLAGVLGAHRLSWVLDTAVAERRVTRAQIAAAAERAGIKTPGIAALRALLEDDRSPARPRSRLEQAVLDLCRQAELPEPQVNAELGPYEVDFLWRAQRVAVEADSYAFHSTRGRLRRDREKDLFLRANGISVMRYDDDQILDRPLAVLADLARALHPRSVWPAA